MKVLHVIPAVAARYGGPSYAVLGMGRALADQGVDVLIATTDADGPSRLTVDLGAVVDWRGARAIFFARQWTEAFKYSRPLARWLRGHVADFDVVHVHAVFSHACLAAASACYRRRVPYLVRPLGSLDPWSLRQKPLRKRIVWHAAARSMLSRAAAVHYTTASEKQLAEASLGLRRGVVIPLGVDDELFADRRPAQPDRPYVLVLGRLHPKKGLEMLLDVFIQLTRQPAFERWKLLVAGDGDAQYVAGLKQLVDKRGGDAQIEFSGWLAGAAKVAALRDAALLALPSQQENFGIVVAEALACGTPVLVSTHVNLAEEVAAAGAGWVVPLQREVVLDTLSEILRDADERRRRGAAGSALAKAHFTWPSVAARLSCLYADLCPRI